MKKKENANIILSEIDDVSTNYIIDWFLLYDEKFIRYNGIKNEKSIFNFDKVLYNLNLENDSFDLLSKNNFKLNSSSLKSIWYRRPFIGVSDFTKIEKSNFDNRINFNLIENNILYHNKVFKDIIIDSFNSAAKKIGTYEKNSLNKFIILKKAKKIGLDIPNTIVTNSQSKAISFLKKNNFEIITKPLYEVISFSIDDYVYVSLTSVITKPSEIPNSFSITLFQNCIEKEYEVRVFYLDGNFYSMAIFSQNNTKTKIDFRDYDQEKMNKMVAFKLENTIEIKIEKLMKELKLNTGSIDLIKSKDGKYYFLEINPIGQFDFLSKNCNYNIEHKIAKYLSS